MRIIWQILSKFLFVFLFGKFLTLRHIYARATKNFRNVLNHWDLRKLTVYSNDLKIDLYLCPWKQLPVEFSKNEQDHVLRNDTSW